MFRLVWLTQTRSNLENTGRPDGARPSSRLNVAHTVLLSSAIVVFALASCNRQHDSEPAKPTPAVKKAAAPPPGLKGKVTPAALVARGREIFQGHGCAACHGAKGKGGVVNANSIRGSVPTLNVLAERMMFDEQKESVAFIALLANDTDLSTLADKPPFATFPRVIEQFHNIRRIIEEGAHPGKADPKGAAPPLVMPAWKAQLAPRDIDALIAYLLTLEDLDA